MPSLAKVRQSNSLLEKEKPGLVAIFAGATSGIGEATCKEFVQHSRSPKVYLVGRNASKGSALVHELRTLNPEATVLFIEADLTLLCNADRVLRLVSEKETKVNLLFLTQGFLSLRGREETIEGLDKMLSLQYFSRIRLITKFLPLLRRAADVELARVVSVLGAGNETQIDPENLEVKHNYSLKNASGQAITMTSLSLDQLAISNPSVSFLHVYPGVVRGTGIMQGMGRAMYYLARIAMSTFARPFTVSLGESGQRHLYAATSKAFVPGQQSAGDSSSFFRLAWDGEPCSPNSVLSNYKRDGVQKMIWERTKEIIRRIAD